MNALAEIRRLRVKVRLKSESRLMCLLAAILGPWFITRAWTTIGGRTIWAPIGTRLADLTPHPHVLGHELVHVRQARRWPFVWQLGYLLAPLPVGLAWCRWAAEREAYLVQLRAGAMSIERAVETLWRSYGWCWPRAWMRRWFMRALATSGGRRG